MQNVHPRFKAGIIAACLLIPWGRGQTAEPARGLEPMLRELSGHIAGVHSLQAEFEQEKHLSVFKQAVVLRGSFFMIKPDRLAWHVMEPVRYSAVIAGDEVRQWDGEAGSEHRMSMDDNPVLREAVHQMRRWFSENYLQMRAEYHIEIKQENPVVLCFAPRDENRAGDFIESVTVRFRKDGRCVEGLRIQEKNGDWTQIRFLNMQLNGHIPSDAWALRR